MNLSLNHVLLKPLKAVEKAYLYSPNLVFMSTSVAKGQGKAVAYATGMGTQFGRIASLTQTIQEEDSPLQKEIASMANLTFLIAVVVGVVFFAVNYVFLTCSAQQPVFSS